MTEPEVLVEPRGDVLLLTLNRPDKLNAWHPGMGRTLMSAIDAANADPAIGAVVMTGAGRAFCAGADVGAVFEQQRDDRSGEQGQTDSGR